MRTKQHQKSHSTATHTGHPRGAKRQVDSERVINIHSNTILYFSVIHNSKATIKEKFNH